MILSQRTQKKLNKVALLIGEARGLVNDCQNKYSPLGAIGYSLSELENAVEKAAEALDELGFYA